MAVEELEREERKQSDVVQSYDKVVDLAGGASLAIGGAAGQLGGWEGCYYCSSMACPRWPAARTGGQRWKKPSGKDLDRDPF